MQAEATVRPLETSRGLRQSILPSCRRGFPRLPVLLLLVALLVSCSPRGEGAQAESGASAPRGIVVSWDGAPDWVVDRLLREGHLPNLAKMAAEGVRFEHSVPPMPSKTAVGHATLWTGAGPGVHGVIGNSVPRSEDGNSSVLERRRGFDSDVLLAEPLYRTAALEGRKVVVLSATHSYPSEPHLEVLRQAGVPEDRLTVFSGFEHQLAEGRLWGTEDLQPAADSWESIPDSEGPRYELALQVAESRFYALLYDSPDDPTEGLDRMLIRAEDRRSGGFEAVLEPAPADPAQARGWSPPFEVRKQGQWGQTHFRLFELAPDGSRLALYQWKASALEGAYTAELARGYQSAYTAFHDDAFWRYRSGRLGTVLMAGGDGTAERRLLEIVAHDTDLLIAGSRWILEGERPDLLFHYSPMTDSAGHTWMGVLDPASPRHDPTLAAELWPFYTQVFDHLDRWLGHLRELAGDETVVALVTDHGMAGTGYRVYPNRILELAGLLHRGANGGIDLERTQILAAEGDFYLRVVDERWIEGREVTPERRRQILEQARQALMSARDPDSGATLFTQVVDPALRPEAEIACHRCGDLYLDPAPGYYPSTRLRQRVAGPQRDPWGSGSHGYWPTHREMHGIAYLAGPGLRRGFEHGPIRHTDLAPTLAHLLGIRPPAQATGQLLEGILAPGTAP